MLRMLVCLLCLLTAGAFAQSAPKKQQKKKAVAPQADTLTGCLDQKEGIYVLSEVKQLRPLAKLEAVGFEQEGFAKFVGHQVTVTGKLAGEGSTAVMKVRTIKSIAEFCVPQGQAGGSR